MAGGQSHYQLLEDAPLVVDDPITAHTLRVLRVQAGLSQRELARRIGFSHVVVGAWERGLARVSPGAHIPLYELFARLQRERTVLRLQVTSLVRRGGRP